MSSRVWLNIPVNHELVMELIHKNGSTKYSAINVYDPIGPAIDPPWDLINGPRTRQIDSRATAYLDIRFFDDTPSEIEVVVRVIDSVNGTVHANTDGSSEFRKIYTGLNETGISLQFFLFV